MQGEHKQRYGMYLATLILLAIVIFTYLVGTRMIVLRILVGPYYIDHWLMDRNLLHRDSDTSSILPEKAIPRQERAAVEGAYYWEPSGSHADFSSPDSAADEAAPILPRLGDRDHIVCSCTIARGIRLLDALPQARKVLENPQIHS